MQSVSTFPYNGLMTIHLPRAIPRDGKWSDEFVINRASPESGCGGCFSYPASLDGDDLAGNGS
jgi:hypothetical protein